eukprot:UN27055
MISSESLEGNVLEKIPLLTIDNIEMVKERLSTICVSKVEWEELVKENWFEKLYDIFVEFENNDAFADCNRVWLVIAAALQSSNSRPLFKHIMAVDKNRGKIIHLTEYCCLGYTALGENNDGKRKVLGNLMAKAERLNLQGLTMPKSIADASKTLHDIAFLKTLIFHRISNDEITSSLTAHIEQVTEIMLTEVLEDDVLKEIFEKISTKSAAMLITENVKDYEDLCFLVGFVREMILRLNSVVEATTRKKFFETLCLKKGMLTALFSAIKDPNVTPWRYPLVWTFVVESISITLGVLGPNIITQFVQHQQALNENEPTLLQRCLQCLSSPCNVALLTQITYLLYTLLISHEGVNPTNYIEFRQCSKETKELNLENFHEHHMAHLVDILTLNELKEETYKSLAENESPVESPESITQRKTTQEKDNKPFNKEQEAHQLSIVKMFVIDILKKTVLVGMNIYRQSIREHNILRKVVQLIELNPGELNSNSPNNSTQLLLSCLRFIRSCIIPNSFYIKLLIEENVFDKLVDVFTRNRYMSNLVNSAVLSIFIKMLDGEKASIFKELILHVGNKHIGTLMNVDAHIFTSFHKHYNQHLPEEERSTNYLQKTPLSTAVDSCHVLSPCESKIRGKSLKRKQTFEKCTPIPNGRKKQKFY